MFFNFSLPFSLEVDYLQGVEQNGNSVHDSTGNAPVIRVQKVRKDVRFIGNGRWESVPGRPASDQHGGGIDVPGCPEASRIQLRGSGRMPLHAPRRNRRCRNGGNANLRRPSLSGRQALRREDFSLLWSLLQPRTVLSGVVSGFAKCLVDRIEALTVGARLAIPHT